MDFEPQHRRILLVVDIEATCGDDIPRDRAECIEFGAVITSVDTCHFMDDYQCFIKPTQNPVLTDFCKQLTGIQQPWVDTSHTFRKSWSGVLDWLMALGIDHMASWGPFDWNVLKRECEQHGVGWPFERHIDLSKLFRNKHGRRMTSHKAAKHFGTPSDGSHHRALVDARRIAGIACCLYV